MDFYYQIIFGALRIVVALVGLCFSAYVLPWVKKYGIPWLKEKRLYSLVKKFVMAAEKMGETGVIEKKDKKKYVLKLLQKSGIAVDDVIEALIETAVEELEEIWNAGVGEVIGEFTTECQPEIEAGAEETACDGGNH